MEPDTYAILSFMLVLGGGLGGLLWRRMERLETELRAELAEMRVELADVKQNMVRRDEFLEVRTEIAGMRSDLTNIALAVGARPRASEA